MTSYDIDNLDVPFLAIFALMGVVQTGIGTLSILNIDFSEVLLSVVGFDVTVAFAGAVLSLAVIGVTNELDPTDLAAEQRSLLGVGVGAMILMQWVPELNSAVMGNDFLGLFVFLLETAAAASISYLG